MSDIFFYSFKFVNFSGTEEKEIEVLTKLKETVDKQREDLRKYSREVKQKNVDIEAVSVGLFPFL